MGSSLGANLFPTNSLPLLRAARRGSDSFSFSCGLEIEKILTAAAIKRTSEFNLASSQFSLDLTSRQASGRAGGQNLRPPPELTYI